MTAHASRRLTRIPADDVAEAIAAYAHEGVQRRTAEDILAAARQEAGDILAAARQEAGDIRAALAAEADALEARLEAEAEKCAERTTQKLASRQNATAFDAALQQVAAIAEDYRKLDGWLADAIIAGVSSILADLPAEDRWAGLISRTLQQTRERWQMTLQCHPDDFSVLQAVAREPRFVEAIKAVERHAEITPGVCYLKGNADYFELDLHAHVEALRAQICLSLNPCIESLDTDAVHGVAV